MPSPASAPHSRPAARSGRSIQTRWRLWTNRLWLLSIALGVATIYSGVSLVHRTSQLRQVATLIATTAGHEIESRAYERLAALQARTGVSIDQLPADSARRLIRPAFNDALDSAETLVRLDSMSLLVKRQDGTVLYGAASPGRQISATIASRGPMAGLTLEIALHGDQIPSALLGPIRGGEALHTGLLLFATALVTALAFGSARREAALASARADFIAGISHDLRMPLAQILLAGETLTMHDDLAAAERHDLASSIVRESRRLVGLIENLLLFSRAGAVELNQRRDPVEVDQLFADVIDSVRLAAKYARQTVLTGASTQLVVIGDRRLLRQALVNLIDNALKYGSPGQQVRLFAELAAQGLVRLSVEDQGPGIPKSEQQHVFDAYERLLRDQTSERTGAGLGLAVVNDIAKACGGRAFIEDPPGRGTRAVIELGEAIPAQGAQA